ncbi:lysozyme inhibitor LprI family protein [Xanthomonas hortorum]|uniref:lysozyme inhibitor LprI family protein n=1 Tax=Xanthomonas hortorum TaxID=56454 RepID=UPI0029355489|nr:lysozyme inhibitor LprI family protein [Xanthomonas hortorum]MDV2450061.1 lysozyme inhibitor LprI family protein [Xanthomonas hortorum NBC5720]
MRPITVILTLLGSSSLHAADLCRDLETTSESNACWHQEVGTSQQRLDEYLGAARERAVSTSGIPADAFDNAQAAWTKYKELHCSNVRRRWGSATVAAAKAASCVVDLNDQRAHDLWKSYLTYADRTAPIRPEPVLRPGK